MRLSEYVEHDATALATLVRQGDVTISELAGLALEACDAVDGAIGAVAERYDDAVRAVDGPSRERQFAGVPFLMKDAGAAEAGRRQEFGSRLLEGRTVAIPSHLATRFAAAGLVSVGRSASPELSLSPCTDSLLRGPTRNPWDAALSAGGSSGGAAAAVAAGIVPIAHATDAAGSIRVPASACGCVGLKPSRGRISHGPELGEPLMGMDTQFVIGRSVRDVAALLDVLSAPAPGDPAWPGPPPRPFGEAIVTTPGRLRIAVAVEAWGGYPTEPTVADAARDVAQALAGMGHELEDAAPPLDYDAFVDAAVTGWALGFDTTIDGMARQLGRRADETTLEPVTLLLYEHARRLAAADVGRAERIANRIRRAFGAFFERYDALLTPTLVRLPEPLGTYSQRVPHESFEAFFRHCDRSGPFLPPFNMTGQPAVSLPLAWSPGGLPIGMQLVGRYGEEFALLALSAALEEALPWRDHVPPVHAGRPLVVAGP